ncbi:MAG: thiamine pyrophosphate-requiring protein [Methylocella sp.]
MAKMTSDWFVQRLKAWGVTRIYGYSGDGINGVLGALQRADEDGQRIDFVQVRHEEMAAFMATAHAKFTGELGVCLSTGGPGATHMLTGLYDAKLDHMPVLAIMGQAEVTARGASYQQELNLDRIFADVGNYTAEVESPAQLRHVIDRGIRIAIAQNGVAAIILPKDVQDADWEEPKALHGFTRSAPGYSRPRIVPEESDLQRAADILNGGSRIAILVGAGARAAAPEIMQIAETLGAGIAKALLGKDVLPDDLPFVTGAIGLLGTKPSYDLMMDCDTLLMIGTGFPWSEFLPKDGQARAVQIDIDPAMLGLRYPVEVNLHGDSALTLRQLLPLLKRNENRSWYDAVVKGVEHWWQTVKERAMTAAEPVNPQRVVWEMSEKLPADAIICADSGTSGPWYAVYHRMKSGQRGTVSGGLASMGAAVPYAIAAKFAHPSRPVVALVGDGAMQMNNMAELITVQRYWRRWADPRLVVCVLNNEDLSEVSWEQRATEGNPRFPATQDLPNVPYAKFASMLGLKGIYVDHPDDLEAAWRDALAADRPVVLEVKTDANVPPLPPHITSEQVKAFLAAFMKGDRPLAGMMAKSLQRAIHERA